MNIAIIGATGMVGRNFIKIMEERGTAVGRFFLYASARSAGQVVNCMGADYTVEELTPQAANCGADVALFAAGNEISREYAPLFAAAGCVVIDNSSALRMEEHVPLVVPEVNGEEIARHKGIIANPNCCAAPAVIALKPLADNYGLARVVITTFQSVSGAGMGGIRELAGGEPFFPQPITGNILPHIGDFADDGYTGEEQKLMAEIRKMLALPDLPITATCTRVPVQFGHSLSVNIELCKPFELTQLTEILASAPGICPAEPYPTPLLAAGNDRVHIGRIRRDPSRPNAINLWLSCDNTRKGAATNAIQILEML
jgi:aspartate-semialdehyde dehydrogenase